MGQSGYAQTFVNLMLGWIRQLAGGIAGMFQTSGSTQASAGASAIAWFSDNWVRLLIALQPGQGQQMLGLGAFDQGRGLGRCGGPQPE